MFIANHFLVIIIFLYSHGKNSTNAIAQISGLLITSDKN